MSRSSKCQAPTDSGASFTAYPEDSETGIGRARGVGDRVPPGGADFNVHCGTDRRIAFPRIVDEPIGADSEAVRSDLAGRHGQQLFHRGAAANGGNL
ncbi:hypothetical protein ACIRRA_25705 [Nocardia sp. NPDC101769]|uniref:hypothetical protein n=1 Tax=Nocardia sp. NPDC101769 TaxID=3364333 RepID=UPI0038246B76